MIDWELRRGTLTGDVELRHMPNSDKRVANFSIAQSKRYQDEQGQWQTSAAHYINVAVWNQEGEYGRPLADMCASLLRKGSKVVVHGQFKTRKYSDRAGNERSATEFIADAVYIDVLTVAAGDEQPPF